MDAVAVYQVVDSVTGCAFGVLRGAGRSKQAVSMAFRISAIKPNTSEYRPYLQRWDIGSLAFLLALYLLFTHRLNSRVWLLEKAASDVTSLIDCLARRHLDRYNDRISSHLDSVFDLHLQDGLASGCAEGTGTGRSELKQRDKDYNRYLGWQF